MSQQGNNGGGYDNTNRFTLFKNKKKVQGDNKPDFTGKVDVNGVLFWLSAWKKTPKQGGDPFLSGTVQPVEENQGGGAGGGQQQQRPQQRGPGGQNQRAPQNPVGGGQEFKEDDIPF